MQLQINSTVSNTGAANFSSSCIMAPNSTFGKTGVAASTPSPAMDQHSYARVMIQLWKQIGLDPTIHNIVATLNELPLPLNQMPQSVQVSLKEFFRVVLPPPPCTSCQNPNSVCFRYFNNFNSGSKVVQPRYGCANCSKNNPNSAIYNIKPTSEYHFSLPQQAYLLHLKRHGGVASVLQNYISRQRENIDQRPINRTKNDNMQQNQQIMNAMNYSDAVSVNPNSTQTNSTQRSVKPNSTQRIAALQKFNNQLNQAATKQGQLRAQQNPIHDINQLNQPQSNVINRNSDKNRAQFANQNYTIKDINQLNQAQSDMISNNSVMYQAQFAKQGTHNHVNQLNQPQSNMIINQNSVLNQAQIANQGTANHILLNQSQSSVMNYMNQNQVQFANQPQSMKTNSSDITKPNQVIKCGQQGVLQSTRYRRANVIISGVFEMTKDGKLMKYPPDCTDVSDEDLVHTLLFLDAAIDLEIAMNN